MKKCKVYKDGSHYIAIRPTTGYSGVRRKPPSEDPIIVEEGCEEPEQAVADAEIKPQEDMAEEQAKAEESEPPCPQEEAPAKNYRVSTRSDEFLRLYRESFGTSRKKQYEYIASGLAPYFHSTSISPPDLPPIFKARTSCGGMLIEKWNARNGRK